MNGSSAPREIVRSRISDGLQRTVRFPVRRYAARLVKDGNDRGGTAKTNNARLSVKPSPKING